MSRTISKARALSRRSVLAGGAASSVLIAAGLPAPAIAQTKTKVLVRFTVKLKGEYAPIFLARDKGYYSDEGLDVELGEGSGSAAAVQAVASKNEHFGYGPSVAVMQAVEKDIPVKTVAIYQNATPYTLISFPNVPLREPKDLEGKSVAFVQGVIFSEMFPAFAKIAKFDLSKVKRVNLSSAVVNGQFLSRDVDVIAVFSSNELPILKKATGVNFNELRVSKYGFDMLGTSFFTNPEYAAANPEVVKKLLRATAKGYADTLKNPAEAATILNRSLKPPMDQSVLVEQVNETMQSSNIPKDKPMGWNDAAVWEQNLQLLLEYGALKSRKDLSSYFTNEYL